MAVTVEIVDPNRIPNSFLILNLNLNAIHHSPALLLPLLLLRLHFDFPKTISYDCVNYPTLHRAYYYLCKPLTCFAPLNDSGIN